MIRAISLFCGAGGMDIGFQEAGVEVVWANEMDGDAAQTYAYNNPKTSLSVGDIRKAKTELYSLRNKGIDLVFGGPPCQGFSVAGKMNPEDERSKMIWEFLDVVDIVKPRFFIMENVKALAQLKRWESVRTSIFSVSKKMGYSCFYRVLNSADFGVPQNRERVFFIGYQGDRTSFEECFDNIIAKLKMPRVTLRQHLKGFPKMGTLKNPQTCTAKITLAGSPVLRKSPYAGMLFNGMGRPLNLESQANTLPASMGGNKTPIIDEMILEDSSVVNWIVNYHQSLRDGYRPDLSIPVPSSLRRITTAEAAHIQTFPMNYVFLGGKSSVYRQIGNAVPCRLAAQVAEAAINALGQSNILNEAI